MKILFIFLMNILCSFQCCAVCFAQDSIRHWNLDAEKLSEFIETKDQIIATGKRSDLLTISPEKVIDAFKSNKRVKLKNVKINGELFFHNEIKSSVELINTTFTKAVNFENANFKKVVNFQSSTFLDEVNFSYAKFKLANFRSVTFKNKTNFSDSVFNGRAIFNLGSFQNYTNFNRSNFNETADFSHSIFSNFSGFYNCIFNKDKKAIFYRSIFLGRSYFAGSKFFGDANFNNVNFSSNTFFYNCLFDGEIDFSKSEFNGLADFSGVAFPNNFKIKFSNTKFSKAYFDWFTNGRYGLKDKLQYYIPVDKIAGAKMLKRQYLLQKEILIFLKKNYGDLGFNKEKNDVEFTYRQLIRDETVQDGNGIVVKHINPIWKRWGEKLFLDYPFGYGVQPSRLTLFYFTICLFFGLVYSKFLITTKNKISINSQIAYLKYFWLLYYSFDVQTPGLELKSIDIMPGCYIFKESRKFYWCRVIQKICGWYLLILFVVMFGKIWA